MGQRAQPAARASQGSPWGPAAPRSTWWPCRAAPNQCTRVRCSPHRSIPTAPPLSSPCSPSMAAARFSSVLWTTVTVLPWPTTAATSPTPAPATSPGQCPRRTHLHLHSWFLHELAGSQGHGSQHALPAALKHLLQDLMGNRQRTWQDDGVQLETVPRAPELCPVGPPNSRQQEVEEMLPAL